VDLLIMECDRFAGDRGAERGGGHMSFVGALEMLGPDGDFRHLKPKQITFVHFGDDGPTPTAGYDEWRDEIFAGLMANGWGHLDKDKVIGYEGMIWP
jgi:hypothetical protein